MNINWKIRCKNPMFWWQIGGALLMPVLAYGGLTVQQLTTWTAVWQVLKSAICNPYVLGLMCVSLWQTINDPTSTGFTDSARALSYTEPNDVKV